MIPIGGSSAVGVFGYVTGTAELVGQLVTNGESPTRLYYPSGSRGTQAGLALGARMYSAPYRLVGIAVSGGEAEKIEGSRVTPGFWKVMGVKPLLGRTWGEAEENSNERVVVLTHALWQSRYAGDLGIVGKDIVLNGEAHRVLGVMPASFKYPSPNGLLAPTYLPANGSERGSSFLAVVGRMKPGVTMEQATARMELRWTSPAVEVFEMYGAGPDGKEMKMMEITYTRR